MACVPSETRVLRGWYEGERVGIRYSWYGLLSSLLLQDRRLTSPFSLADVAKSMDESLPELEKSLEPYFENFGQRKDAAASASVSEILGSERFSQNRGPLTDTRKG